MLSAGAIGYLVPSFGGTFGAIIASAMTRSPGLWRHYSR